MTIQHAVSYKELMHTVQWRDDSIIITQCTALRGWHLNSIQQ